MIPWGSQPSCPLPPPSHTHGGTPAPNLALPRSSQEMCLQGRAEGVVENSGHPGDQLAAASLVLRPWRRDGVCSQHVPRDTGSLFPILDLDRVLVYRGRSQLFLWGVKKARCGEGIGRSCRFSFITLSDPTLKGSSLQWEPLNILVSTSRSHPG